MAEIRRVVASDPISNFRNAAPTGGGVFSTIASLAETAYERLAPAAAEEMKALGAERGREMARQYAGQNRSVSLASTGMGTSDTARSASPPPVTTRSLDNPNDPRNLAADTMDALGKGPGVVNASSVRNGLVQRGIPEHVAEAFAWNAADESGFNPGINEANPTVAGSRGGFGLFQWTGPRRRQLEAFATERGVEPSDFETQLDFLVTELQGSEKSAGSEILSTSDTPTAAATIVNRFLRPAESHRASRERRYLAGQGASDASAPRTTPGGQPQPAVMVRTSAGKLEPRMFSPLAGPILQMHNAAQITAFTAEMMNSSAIDLFDISNDFEGNPDGFNEAATSYIDQMMENLPDEFRPQLRSQLEERASQRYMGMVEEKHREIRTRAVNSSTALMDRYQGELADAIAGGNEEVIAAAASRLDDVLVNRESLPGIAWTPEQSDNVRLGASEAAAATLTRRQKEASDEVKSQLETIIEARKNGQTSAYENILQDPTIAALHPELAREAAGWVAFAAALPSFDGGTEAERTAALADLRSMPVVGEFQVDILKAAEERNDQINEAWDANPIDAANQFLPNQPPPPLPQPGDPNYVKALEARREYALGLQEAGYTNDAVIFSDDEAAGLSLLLSKTTPPDARLAVAGLLVAGLGEEATRGFRQLTNVDPVTSFAGKLIARGGNGMAGIAAEAMQGQILLDEKQAILPKDADRISAFDADMAQAVWTASSASGMDPATVQTEIMTFASALYAARSAGIEPNSEAAKTLMQQSVQAAMGQSVDARGRTTGGVQKIGNHSALLPPGVSGEAMNNALEAMVATTGGGFADVAIEALKTNPLTSTTGLALDAVRTETVVESPWLAATAVEGQEPSLPYVAGEPMPPSAIANGEVRFIPIGGNNYRMEVVRQGGAVPVEAADGRTLIVDVTAMIKATR